MLPLHNVQHCFARTDAVVDDEYQNLGIKSQAFEAAAKEIEPRERWPVVPVESRKDKWSPILNQVSFHSLDCKNYR